MKILNFSLLLGLFLIITSCKQQTSEGNSNKKSHMMNDSKMMNHDSTMIHNSDKKMDTNISYSCPMHPEVIGSKGDKCPKCGMDLEQIPTKDL
ncbi:heavy metal-binding domain-containing protein [Flavobacterium sp. GP15]|uniref:heavy metal-binding domain-containing protein n=1 Tax=Flavobacterium sp. GP15 TaxID=2758567 RepID=UPI001CB6DB0B|nr:heavy metal-binding domain-containing protein [Flavobacterium sp. GP15]